MALKTTGAGALAALGAAALLGAVNPSTAMAAEPELPLGNSHLANTDAAKALGGTTSGLGAAVNPIRDLRLDPWANSGADVLNNGASLVPDNGLKPVSTATLTAPLSKGGGPKDIPFAGQLLSVLPH